MKKLLLFVIACTLGLFGTVNAQETITVGEGSAQGYVTPVDVYSAYYLSQQIYTADEIAAAGGSAGTITQIGFNRAPNSGTPTRNWSIYLTNTTESSFPYETFLVSPSDKVFSGSFAICEDWNTFDLTAFEYTGGNLLVTVVDNTGVGGGDVFWYGHASTLAVAGGRSSLYNPESVAEYMAPGYTNRNQIQLTFAAAGEGGEEGGEELASEFSFDFEDGTLEGWNVFQESGATSNNWAIGSGAYLGGVNDGYCVYSLSYNNSTLIAKNYIVTAEAYQITEESVLSWWIKHTYPGYETYDPYAVVVSTDGENFEQVADYTPVSGNTVELSLAAYAGQNLYIGFYHYGQGGDGICIDNIKLTAGEGGETPDPTPDPEPEPEPEPEDICTLVLTMTDTYGDGWNGNYLVVEYGDVSQQFDFSVANYNVKEYSKEYTLEIPQGTNAKATYTLGGNNTYPSENGFTIAYEGGKEAVSAATGTLNATTSFEFYVSCIPTAPEKPVITATATGGSTIVLTMSAAEADSYNVYQNGEVLVEGLTETTYTVEGLTASTEYCYTVVAVNEIGESEVSETACVTTFDEGTVIVSIGEGEIAQFSAPVYNAAGYNYSLSQVIYTEEEIGLEGNAILKSISYHHYSGNNNTRNIIVYLQNVEKASFDGAYDWIPVSESDIVYQGEFTFGKAGDWATITFQNDFEYTGGNLAVTVYDQSGTNYGYSYDLCDKFYHSEISEARGKYYTNQNAMDLSQIATFYGTTMNTGAWGNPKNVYYINNIKLRAIATEGGETPEPTPTFTHRLESVGTAWGNTAYTFDEENANRVVAIDEDGIVTEVTYNEAGQIASAIASYEDVDEEGNPVEVVISGVEYEYDENGVWTSYTETSQMMGGTVTSETALNYDAEGRLVSLASEEYVRTIAYNEAGLISEVVEGYIVVEEEGEEGEEGDDNGIAPLSETEIEYSSKITFEYDAEGRLVEKNYYSYDAYETMEFYWGESEVYTYDENGNCVKKEAYEVTEENELKSFPYSVTEYIYDLTINNENVYSFEYPHFAFINYVEPSYANILVKEMSFYSYYDEDVEEVVSHSYEVTAYNYNPAVVLLPLTPMNLTAEVLSATEVELAWAGFPDAETFTLYQVVTEGLDPCFIVETVIAEGLVDPYYTVENLEMGVEYCFAVMATNSVGNSEVSEIVCVTIELPAAPANLVAEAISDTEIALTWDEVPGIYSYNVYQVVETAEETTYELLGEAWWTEYTVSELTAETEYSFVVKAVSNVGESAASNVATATTLAPAAPTVPAAPVVTGSFEGDKVTLEWEAVEGALYYNLYYGGKLLSGEFVETIVDIQVPAPGEYCFTVTAVNEVGESEHSEEVCVTVTVPEGMEAPAAPVLEVTLDGNKAILSWEAVEGATYYDVYIGSTPEQAQYLGTATMEDLPISLELPEPGEYCFFVVAYNLAGASEPSNVACVNYGEGVEENEVTFNIYPNPVSDNLVIETEANIEAVTIYTVTGVVVYNEVEFSNNTINVSDFANGVYIMKVRTENGEAVQRFIKK